MQIDPAVVAGACAAMAKWGIPASVSLAQFALESGWGKHMPPGSNNPFGIKAVGGQAAVDVPTHEFVHGHMITETQPFAVFSSIAAAIDAHARLLASIPAYAAARAKLPDASAFAMALTGVYATDPNYGAKLCSLIRASGLAQYDAPRPSPPSPTKETTQ